jgi:hypothetical protein
MYSGHYTTAVIDNDVLPSKAQAAQTDSKLPGTAAISCPAGAA